MSCRGDVSMGLEFIQRDLAKKWAQAGVPMSEELLMSVLREYEEVAPMSNTGGPCIVCGGQSDQHMVAFREHAAACKALGAEEVTVGPMSLKFSPPRPAWEALGLASGQAIAQAATGLTPAADPPPPSDDDYIPG